MKFLVRWKLILGPEQLKRFSGKPGLQHVGLDYVRGLVSSGKVIGVYRFKTVESRAHMSQPSGIAIVEAKSAEEIKEVIDAVPGLTREERDSRMEEELEPKIEAVPSSAREIRRLRSVKEVRPKIETVPGLVREARGMRFFEYEIEPIVELPYGERKEV